MTELTVPKPDMARVKGLLVAVLYRIKVKRRKRARKYLERALVELFGPEVLDAVEDFDDPVDDFSFLDD